MQCTRIYELISDLGFPSETCRKHLGVCHANLDFMPCYPVQSNVHPQSMISYQLWYSQPNTLRSFFNQNPSSANTSKQKLMRLVGMHVGNSREEMLGHVPTNDNSVMLWKEETLLYGKADITKTEQQQNPAKGSWRTNLVPQMIEITARPTSKIWTIIFSCRKSSCAKPVHL